MTERESEQFYDDLRRKLEDYGSAPPESVWAGIREQVPVRRRWGRGAVLAVLVVLIATVAYVTTGPSFWRTGSLTPVSTTKPTSVTSRQPVATGAPTAGTAPNSASPATTISPNGSRTTAPDATVGMGSASASQRPPLKLATTPEVSSSHEGKMGTLAGQPAPTLPKVDTTSTSGTKGRYVAAVGKPAGKLTPHETARTTPLVASQGAARQRRRTKALLAVSHPERGETRPSGRQHAAPQPTLPSLTATINSHSAATLSTSAAQPEARSVLSVTRPSSHYRLGLARASVSAPGSQERLALLLVRLQVPQVSAPQLAYAVATERKAQQLPKQNWSVQLLAGPTLSYRTLGSGAQQVEELERPAAGFGGQLSLTRTITPRFSVSGGLGYARFASRLHLRIQKPASLTAAASSRTVDFRNYFRLFTLPLEAQYQVGSTHRWRYGVQAGAVPALLFSARTTEGTACNCQQQQWQPNDSTGLGRLNLTFTAGAR
ncbi:outer membrane beta-barrel protein [Hymenobacter sp. AT01-02]|uniref:outer membrane beta-barrel protein n=1 Tax=Hymenobacter sp. AT01-02 TaxID=1571877 RepID=UPI0006E18E02|nr:outer membrane beta-barrel protein [Hymenobacter sp. AT01-02]